MTTVGLNSSNTWKSELKDWVTRDKAPASPVEFAIRTSRGRYQPAKHLWLLNEYLLKVSKGEITRLMICMPPRHSKSMTTSEYFPAWYLGKYPDRSVILTSYESDYAASWGRKVRGLIEEYGSSMFPHEITTRKDSRAANRWNIEGHTGGMYTAGAGGALTGKGGELIIIDDPHKNDQEAASPTIQEKIWDWYQATLLTRLHPGGCIILILTRWHTGDLAGRLLEHEGEDWTVLSLPAIAEENDMLGREPGEPLWPERFPLPFLNKIKSTQRPFFWSALYQQRPYDEEGGMFQPEWFEIVDEVPSSLRYTRGWDFAATQDAGDYCGGILMGYKNGLYYVVDAQQFRKDGEGVLQKIESVAHQDGHRARIRWEQEKASAGKILSASMKKTIFKGFNAEGVTPSGSKEVRATPFSNAVKAGLVKILRGEWNRKYLEQLKLFPYGKNDDMVDGSAYAFNDLEQSISEPAAVGTTNFHSKYAENNSGQNRWNKYQG